MQNPAGNSLRVIFEEETPYWYSLGRKGSMWFLQKVIVFRDVPRDSPDYLAVSFGTVAYINAPYNFQADRLLEYPIDMAPAKVLNMAHIQKEKDNMRLYEFQGLHGAYQILASGCFLQI
jgi:hypothetical protein